APRLALLPYTTLFRSGRAVGWGAAAGRAVGVARVGAVGRAGGGTSGGSGILGRRRAGHGERLWRRGLLPLLIIRRLGHARHDARSEEHTSELQSLTNL